jgi:hypothetical protein
MKIIDTHSPQPCRSENNQRPPVESSLLEKKEKTPQTISAGEKYASQPEMILGEHVLLLLWIEL